jgi:hypothetical protein
MGEPHRLPSHEVNVMKHLFRIIALAAGLTAGTARAGQCDSAASLTADIWGEYDQLLKTAGCAVVSIVSEGAVPPNLCLDSATKAAEITEQMISFWNKAANNSWATIGPRRLDLDTQLEGKLVGFGDRVFSSVKPLDQDRVELRLQKTDGKAKTIVRVCTDYRGKRDTIWEFTIDNGKGNEGKVWTKTLDGVKGRILLVDLDARSAANTLSYELKATPAGDHSG